MCISRRSRGSHGRACACVCTARAALDLAWLAAGRLHATLMLSNLPWDVTAGLLLVREAGGVVFDYDGSSHDADSRFTIASAPSLAEAVRGIVVGAM